MSTSRKTKDRQLSNASLERPRVYVLYVLCIFMLLLLGICGRPPLLGIRRSQAQGPAERVYEFPVSVLHALLAKNMAGVLL
jgi:hypothetical protein